MNPSTHADFMQPVPPTKTRPPFEEMKREEIEAEGG